MAQIEITSSNCLRMRFNRNRCSLCIDICPHTAISIDNAININEDKCTQCGLCYSACPTAAVNFAFPYSGILKEMKKFETPVIGCSYNTKVESNIKINCFGSLGVEPLLFLNTFIDREIQFNCTECETCKNAFAYNHFKADNQKFEEETAIKFEKILLIENKEHIKYKTEGIERRKFFRNFLGTAINTRNEITQDIVYLNRRDYKHKEVPLRREMLNFTIDYLSETEKEIIKSKYYHELPLSEPELMPDVAVFCPTGAIALEENLEEKSYTFSQHKCVACNLCEEASLLFRKAENFA